MAKSTLQQIADLAGVTRGQVSRVLNQRYKENRPAIALKAKRIREIAESMGYRPNMAARSIAKGRFGQIAFVTCGDLGFDWFPPDLLHGIHRAIDATNNRLAMAELSGSQFADPENMPRLFRESAVDGMLINIDAKLPPSILEAFDAQPVPAVLLNQKRNTRSVHPDELAGGRLAAEWLVKAGRKRIGYLCLQPHERGPHFSKIDRLAGFRAALADTGRDPHDVLAGDPAYDPSTGNGLSIVSAFLDRTPGLDALVCYSPVEAAVAHVVAAMRGMRVPDDLHLLVFDHKVAHGQTGIPCDTIIIPFRTVGTTGVDMLLGMVENHDPRRQPSKAIAYERIYDAQRREMHPIVQ